MYLDYNRGRNPHEAPTALKRLWKTRLCGAFLHIDWAGDVGELRVDGRTATDRFWDGSTWTVNLRDAGWHPGAEVTLHLLPLAAGSTVSLPAEAHERLLSVDGQLLDLASVRLVTRCSFHEETDS